MKYQCLCSTLKRLKLSLQRVRGDIGYFSSPVDWKLLPRTSLWLSPSSCAFQRGPKRDQGDVPTRSPSGFTPVPGIPHSSGPEPQCLCWLLPLIPPPRRGPHHQQTHSRPKGWLRATAPDDMNGVCSQWVHDQSLEPRSGPV